MKLFKRMKDGGPLSKVYGFFLIEWKRLFSVAVLRFDHGARDAYHTHAFNAVSWVLWGKLVERTIWGSVNVYEPSFRPILTPRDMFHKVESVGTTWAITFRGPWVARWTEYLPDELQFVSLTNHRVVVADGT